MANTWITFPDKSCARIPAEDASVQLVAWFQDKLRQAHQHPEGSRCGCVHTGRSLGVVIRRLPTDRFILARMPNEGPLHRESCAFHAADTDRSGLAGYVRSVVEETADGGIRIRLDQSLTLHGPAPQPAEIPAFAARAGAARQRAMTPLGLLHLLWETAGLNRWHPGFRDKRPAWFVAVRLETAAEQIRVARTELAEGFTALAENRSSGTRLRHQASSFGARRKLVVVAEVTGIDPEVQGRRNIRLAGGGGAGLFLSAAAGMIDGFEHRFPYANRLLSVGPPQRPGPARVMGLFIVSVKIGKWRDRPVIRATLEGGALMEVSQHFIPIASDLERQVADRLVDADREFAKPLRFDADADLVLPDFVLMDAGTTRGTPMEVFGRNDEEYLIRRAEKEAYYRVAYGVNGFWLWIAAGRDRTPMPDFPPRV